MVQLKLLVLVPQLLLLLALLLWLLLFGGLIEAAISEHVARSCVEVRQRVPDG